MPATHPWWIERLEQLRKEQRREYEERPSLQLPIPEPAPRPSEATESPSESHVIIIDLT